MAQKTKTSTRTTAKKSAKSTVGVHDTAGRAAGRVSLPKDFAETVSDALLAQAMHVYRSNQHPRVAATKTRGHVSYSTRKIYRQKGTGRARHGSRRAPIFVGGGVTFGPQPKQINAKLPAKMRRKALIGALHRKVNDKQIVVITSLSSFPAKTKQASQLLASLELADAPSILCVVAGERAAFRLAMRNIPQADVVNVHTVNAYDILTHQHIVIEKEAFVYFDTKN